MMRWVVALLCVAAVVLATDNVVEFERPRGVNRDLPQIRTAWNKFKAFYNKIYTEVAEEETHMHTWLANLAHIELHNARYLEGETSYSLEMNEYGDQTAAEFLTARNGYKHELRLQNIADETHEGVEYRLPVLYSDEHDSMLPSSVDWRKHGLVTEVKNQGQCGSCWSFSATGALEGQTMRSTGELPSISEQNLVDCSRPEGNMGCNGGLMDNAFTFIKREKGIDSESSYPYEMRDDQSCRYKKKNSVATDKGFMDIPSGSEKHLKHALATQGPISIAIDAGHRSFQFYSTGVYYEPQCSSSQLDHGVLLVGYGDLADELSADELKEYEGRPTKYWLVKNSWGTEWGDEGYIKMARGKNNHCGVATAASYPLV